MTSPGQQSVAAPENLRGEQGARETGASRTWSSRTIVCTVLIADIVGYSKQSVQRQQEMKEAFNAALGQALKLIAWGERIVMDTGDGATVAFLGGAEEAVLAALFLLREMSARADAGLLRIGVHLGPCKIMRGVNGTAQVVGDGVNDTLDILAFAAPEQMTVSRAYFDVLSGIDEDYPALFAVQAPRADGNDARLECHYLHDRRNGDALQRADRLIDRVRGTAQPGAQSALEPKTRAGALLQNAWRVIGRSARKPAHVVMTAGALAVLGAGWLAVSKSKPVQAAPAVTQSSGRQIAAARSSETPAPSAAKAPSPANPGKVLLAIQPWGEVHIDGKLSGVSPPLKTLGLDPGKHRIEVRNGNLPPYLQTVDVPSGGAVLVKHSFDAAGEAGAR